ncbi:juvenile hormone acid O-methyltransferase-like [Musca vetustissima]|uniref:juvenile hormone acid O-methyltransferase-like n=1 Tax=Musca vetustissima TaxID=27455 RepID=UPI002AB655F3|nr:juvenile hormone acid O-methyltransferase-like [Musca vetustissima]
MNQASLYHRANEVQRHDAEQIIQEYVDKFEWRHDGMDCLLDVGTGSGDVLMDFVYPIMPKKFDRIVGSDISRKMIEFARKCYRDVKQCEFKVLDIGTEEQLPKDMKGAFDHVTSFYCLHWIQNQRQALQNIYDLLRTEGGDCLLVFLASNAVYDVCKLLSKSTNWSPYMQDVNRFISPLHHSNDAKWEFTQMLKETGFTQLHVEMRDKVYIYQNEEILKDNFKAICPFLERIPLSQHNDFLDDFVDTVTSLDLRRCDPNGKTHKFLSPYKLIVAYAKKPALVENLLSEFIISAEDQEKKQENGVEKKNIK